MAVGRQPGLAHHVFVALAHQRDFPRAAAVGAGRVQAEEALLGSGATVLVELEHANVIHVTGAVHGGARIGLGQDQRIHRSGLRHVVRRHGLEVARLALLAAAQQAQAGGVVGAQQFAAALADYVVFAIAQEGEMVVGGPAQELLRLGAAGIGHRHGPRGQFIGNGQHPGAHRAPVGDRGAHVLQDRADARFDLRHLASGLAIDLHVDQRLALGRRPGFAADRDQLAGLVALHRHHRMAEHMHAHALVRQGHGHRVDQERHVVVDHLDHGVWRFPAVLAHAGVEHAHFGHAGLALARHLEEIPGQVGPAVGAMLDDLVLGHALVESLGERLGLRLHRLGDPLAQRLQDRLDGRLAPRGPGLACGGGLGLLLRCVHGFLCPDAVRPAQVHGPRVVQKRREVDCCSGFSGTRMAGLSAARFPGGR